MSNEGEFREIFDEYDRNGDGRIETSDICHVIRRMNWDVTQTKLLVLTRQLDPEESGYVHCDDLWKIVQTRPTDEEQEDELRKAFMFFDKERTGELDARELRASLTDLGDILTEEEVDDVLQNSGLDNYGKINCNEFIRYLRGRPVY